MYRSLVCDATCLFVTPFFPCDIAISVCATIIAFVIPPSHLWYHHSLIFVINVEFRKIRFNQFLNQDNWSNSCFFLNSSYMYICLLASKWRLQKSCSWLILVFDAIQVRFHSFQQHLVEISDSNPLISYWWSLFFWHSTEFKIITSSPR